jgi:hypothetical protein
LAIGTPVDRGRAGGTTSATTASFTPTANSVLLALISSKAGTAPSPSISDSLSGTWTLITAVNGPATNPFIVGGLYYQQVGASPSAMTVSATGGSTSTVVAVIEVTGCGTDFSNVAVNTNTAGDPSCTLPSAPGATSAVFGFAVGHLSNAFTQTAGFTELYDSIPTGASNHRVEFAYDLSSPAQTLGWTSTETNSVGVAFEVKEPASGAITATASPTLSAFVSAAAAKALVEGTGAGTLNPFTAASVAKVRGKATASVTPAAFVSTSAAAVRVKAAASATPNAFVSQAAADILVKGAGAGILSAFGVSSAATVRVKASAGPALNAFTLSAVADVVSLSITASASVALSPFVSAAAAKALVEGIGGGTLNPFSASASAKVRISGSTGAGLEGFVSSANARIRIGATAVLEWGPITSEGRLFPVPEGLPPLSRTAHVTRAARTDEVAAADRTSAIARPGRFGRAGGNSRVGRVTRARRVA